jgi:Flp pilus assembly protein TadB
MKRRERRFDDFAEPRWRDRLSVIGLVALAVGLVVRLLLDGVGSWPSAVVGAALMSVWVVFLVRRRRRHDARETGAEPEDVPAMERRILKGGPPPEDPRHRQTLAALVDSRQRRLRRSRWWAFPLLTLILFGTSILWFVSGSVTGGSWTLALAVAGMGWLTWFNLRFDRRLSQMRRRLRS